MKDFSIDIVWSKIQTAIAALGGWLGYFLGGMDGMLIALIVFMVLDYITGIMCAVVDKKLSSAIGFKGIFKKVLILILVGVATLLDKNVVGSGSTLRTAIIAFYLSNEGVSILENASHLGLPVPQKLKDILAQLHKREEKEKETEVAEDGGEVDTPFTNEHFADWCKKMAEKKSVYFYGTCCYRATASLLKKKRAQYPSYYLTKNEKIYQEAIRNKQIAADCIGGVKGYAWTGGGQGVLEAIGTDNTFSNKYGSNGCPDYGATGMFEYARKKGCPHGVIATLPEVPGVALYKPGHAGYYVGNGYAVEWCSTAYGCVKTAVKGRGWTNWYALPFIDYGEADIAGTAKDIPLGGRLLQKGSSGEDVRTLQQTLIGLGYDVGTAGADGKFGSNTENAVKAFQSRNGLKVDGKYGNLTHAALMAVTSEAEDESADKLVEETATEKTVQIVYEDGSVDIRIGNGSGYEKITVAEKGSSFPYVATADNGWIAIVIGDKVGWIDGAYIRIE